MDNTTETKRKATRKIKKFDFSDDKATVSLVGDAVGGAANGYVTLVTKANKKVSEEFIKKASTVTVTLSITEYLRKFFDIWYEDAEILARALGFTTEEMERQEDDEPCDYNKYIDEKVASIKVMKSLKDAENIEEALINLSEEDYLQVLQDQEVLEKALATIEKNSTAKAGDTSTINASVESEVGVTTPVVKRKSNKEKSMTKEVQTIEQSVEVIEKAKFDALQKSLEDNQVQLQKALEQIAAFEAERKEAIAKARKEELTKACGAETAEVIFKACGNAEDEIFADVVKALGVMQAKVESSDLFKETGASVSAQEDANESPIAKALKARLSKQQ